jgi:ElaB/YqjD/DUF883 family membrane-anchored ribosome-binding protein
MSQNALDLFGKKISELGYSGHSLLNDPELQRKISKVKKDTETIIRKNPIASIGVGLLAGFLIGKLLSRD